MNKNVVDQMTKSFNLTVFERLKKQPAFRQEVLCQIEECIHNVLYNVGYGLDDLKRAKIMLDQVIQAMNDMRE